MTALEMVPIAKIRVLNPRARNKAKFSEIVANIARVGLKKPIKVARREGSGGEYDLVYGQGRIEAFSQLGETHIPAIVVNATIQECYLMSLIENLARRAPDSLQLVRDIAGLEKHGYTAPQIAEKVGFTEPYVRGILRLYGDGENLLLVALERGNLPLVVAIEIASAKDGDVKRCLAEAYERGDLKGKNAVSRARAVVERRIANGKRASGSGPGGETRRKMSADDIVNSYKRAMQKQAQLVRKAHVCDGMLRVATGALRELTRDEHFVTLLRAEALDKMPKYVAEQVSKRGSK